MSALYVACVDLHVLERVWSGGGPLRFGHGGVVWWLGGVCMGVSSITVCV